MRILVILGEGGHTVEMLRLLELLGPRPEYEYHYFLVREETISEQRVRYPGTMYWGNRPRWKNDTRLTILAKQIRLTLQSLRVLWVSRPRVILHSGPGVAVPAALLGKIAGAKIVYVENGARVTGLSRSGRLMYRVADLFFVQWPELKQSWPKAIYAGSLHG